MIAYRDLMQIEKVEGDDVEGRLESTGEILKLTLPQNLRAIVFPGSILQIEVTRVD